MTRGATKLRAAPVEERLNDAGIWAFESRHSAAFRMPLTVHRFPKLLLLREGCGHVEGDLGDWVCKSGDCVLIPPGCKHRVVDDSYQAISLYGLGVASRWFQAVPEIQQALPWGVVTRTELTAVMTEHRMRRILYLDRQSDPASRLACVAAALELFAEVVMVANPERGNDARHAEQTGDDPLLTSFLGWLERHFYEPLSLDAAASACGMSRRHFTTQFKRRTGTTWLEYLHRLRVQHAIRLLEQTNRKITSIAFESGFEDLSTFYRVVARLTGKRPSEIRAAAHSSASA